MNLPDHSMPSCKEHSSCIALHTQMQYKLLYLVQKLYLRIFCAEPTEHYTYFN